MAAISAEEIQRVKDLLATFFASGDAGAASELFTIIDRDGSGSLEADEIEPVLVAVTGKTYGEGEVEAVIKAADEDGNSTIEPNEFQGLLNNEGFRALLA